MYALVWTAALGAAVLAIQPGDLDAQRVEFTGEAALETRLFPQPPQYDGQSGALLSPSVRLEPEFVYEWANGTWRFSAMQPASAHLISSTTRSSGQRPSRPSFNRLGVG